MPEGTPCCAQTEKPLPPATSSTPAGISRRNGRPRNECRWNSSSHSNSMVPPQM